MSIKSPFAPIPLKYISNPRKVVINREEPRKMHRSVLASKPTGMMEREKVIDDLKKENFGLKMRIYYLSQNIQNLTPAGMQHIIHQHAEFKCLIEEWKRGRPFDINDIPDFGSNPLYTPTRSAYESPDVKNVEEALANTEQDLLLETVKNSNMVSQLRTARKMLKELDNYVNNYGWIKDTVQNGTKWLGEIETSYIEKMMKERLENELEALNYQQKVMKEELYAELAQLKLEQELQDKKDQLYVELADLKSQQSQLEQQSTITSDEDIVPHSEESSEWDEQGENEFDSNEETIPSGSPVKAVTFESDLESSEEEFYY